MDPLQSPVDSCVSNPNNFDFELISIPNCVVALQSKRHVTVTVAAIDSGDNGIIQKQEEHAEIIDSIVRDVWHTTLHSRRTLVDQCGNPTAEEELTKTMT